MELFVHRNQRQVTVGACFLPGITHQMIIAVTNSFTGDVEVMPIDLRLVRHVLQLQKSFAPTKPKESK